MRVGERERERDRGEGIEDIIVFRGESLLFTSAHQTMFTTV